MRAVLDGVMSLFFVVRGDRDGSASRIRVIDPSRRMDRKPIEER